MNVWKKRRAREDCLESFRSIGQKQTQFESSLLIASKSRVFEAYMFSFQFWHVSSKVENVESKQRKLIK